MAADTELVIAGGGLTGLLLGVACARAGLAVAIIDRHEPLAMLGARLDGRTAAIDYGSRNVLDAIGLWTDIVADAQPILEIRVADDRSPLFLHYDHRELEAGTPLGYIVENRVLRRQLIDCVRSIPTLHFLTRIEVGSVSASSHGVTATLSDGRQIEARLVAAADGGASPPRNAAGIGTVEWRYPQASIVTSVRHERVHHGVAIEYFLPAGPFAILPMTGNRSSIVWTERSEFAPRLIELSDAAFTAELVARFGDFLGAVEPIGTRWTYPLALKLAKAYMDPRLALIAEGANVIHPIAGQGLNLGIRDVAVLAELVIDARRLGLDIGDEGVLRRYQQWRRFDALALASVTDGLNRLFSNALPPVRLVRRPWLAVVQRLPPLKRSLMRDAIGLFGDLPRPVLV